jgi:hypothetical protein
MIIRTGIPYRLSAYTPPRNVAPCLRRPLFYSGPLLISFVDIVFAPTIDVQDRVMLSLGMQAGNFPKGAGAAVKQLTNADGCNIILVTYDYDFKDGVTNISNRYAAHEALHIAYAVNNIMGDHSPSEEATATMCGYFGEWLMEETKAIAHKIGSLNTER